MEKYLTKFDTHADYLAAKDELLLPNVSLCVQENEVHYNPVPYDYSQDYFTVESLEDNASIKYSGGVGGYSVSVSTNNGETWTSGTYINIILNAGEKLLIKGNNTMYYDYEGYAYIQSVKQHIIYGKCILLFYPNIFR